MEYFCIAPRFNSCLQTDFCKFLIIEFLAFIVQVAHWVCNWIHLHLVANFFHYCSIQMLAIVHESWPNRRQLCPITNYRIFFTSRKEYFPDDWSHYSGCFCSTGLVSCAINVETMAFDKLRFGMPLESIKFKANCSYNK